MEDDLCSNNGKSLLSYSEYSEGNNITFPMECERGNGISIEAKEISENGCMVKPDASSANLPKEVYVYRQDIVRCNRYGDLLGVVMEVAGDSDSEGDVTDVSDVEDGEGNESNDKGDDGGNNDGGDTNESLSDGQVRVMWTDGSETTNNLSDIVVMDREFLHGDIVASVSDATGQLGLVVDVSISVDLLAPTGEMIKNVSSRNLKRVREFTSGDYIVCGPWLGRVDDVLDNVTVVFDDGSVCKVVKADPLRLKPVSKSIVADAGFPYYPGQRVRAVSSSVFKTSRWLSGLWKANRLEGTVTKVQAASVFVYWMASASPGTGNSSAAVPSEEQSPKNLTLLSCFTHANWQLGDWCLLPSSQLLSDTSTAKDVEDSITDCGPIDCSMEHVVDESHDHTRCVGSSEPGISVPIVDLKDEQQSDIMHSDDVVQDEGCTTHHPIPTNSPDYVISMHSGDGCNANSIMAENSSETFFSGENNVLVSSDRASDSSSTQVADRRNTVLQSGSFIHPSTVPLKESVHESCPAYRKKLRKVFFRREKKTHKREEPFERAFFVASTVTKVDVAWQDGTRVFGVDSKSLIPIQSPGDHEFFPEQYVVEKASSESDDSSEVKRVGVVRSVNAKERTALVRWLKPVSRPEDPREFDSVEVVSAYELAEHPDYDYCYGDLVIRLSPFSTSDFSPISDNPVEQEDDDNLPQVSDEMSQTNSGYEVSETLKDEADANFSSLSWVGHITGLQDGDIEVTWADGMISKVGPQAIYVVGREDGESFNGGSDVSDDGASWETVEENEMTTLDVIDEDPNSQPPTNNIVERENCTTSPGENSNPVCNEQPLSISFALGFITRLASGLFSRGRKETDSSCADEDGIKESESQHVRESPMRDTATNELSYQESDVSEDRGAHITHDTREICNLEDVAAETEAKMGDNLGDHEVEMDVDGKSQLEFDEHDLCSFKHFDIAKDPLDHHFVGENGQNSYGRKWIKKVQKEWSILEKNLPDAIFVRVFEDRMDLLRAVIVGACGTPYQDGLFFFDFHLPSEYPQVPPSAYYHSGGLRINPNLYEEGKVCLSLLNTWTGKGNEVWDPNSSSILQVLVSIQGLVLNSRPYFNEAGYEKQVGTAEGEKNSLPYNENTYLLNLRSMLYLLRRPPMHFEDFVKDHFRRRGHYILKACDAYMNGCIVGSLTKDACMTDKSNENSSSVGFKLMLAKIIPKLFMALSEVGAECQQFEHLHKS
uniref:E2 ubiquitin-conjugating enzyme n=3 Tax=Anthurium amnicola TaxID=1678845 RepID=A0A1D1Y5Q9_9ARAE